VAGVRKQNTTILFTRYCTYISERPATVRPSRFGFGEGDMDMLFNQVGRCCRSRVTCRLTPIFNEFKRAKRQMTLNRTRAVVCAFSRWHCGQHGKSPELRPSLIVTTEAVGLRSQSVDELASTWYFASTLKNRESRCTVGEVIVAEKNLQAERRS
jgi:hypothetical protein